MKITRELILNNYTQKDINEILFCIDRFQKVINYYKHHDIESYNTYLELMGEEGRKLMFEGELSDELIKLNQNNGTQNDRTYEENGITHKDTWQTTFKMKLMKICTEIETLIYLNNQAIFDIGFNQNASNISDANSRPNSEPDFIIKNGKERIYVEMKAYINREELPHRVEFKEWQFNNLKRKIDDGKKVYILQKHYLKNGTIIYQLYDLKELLEDKKYTWHECDLEVNKESHIYKHYVFCNNVETDVEIYEDIENTYSIQFTNGRYYSF